MQKNKPHVKKSGQRKNNRNSVRFSKHPAVNTLRVHVCTHKATCPLAAAYCCFQGLCMSTILVILLCILLDGFFEGKNDWDSSLISELHEFYFCSNCYLYSTSRTRFWNRVLTKSVLLQHSCLITTPISHLSVALPAFNPVGAINLQI